MNAFVKLFSGLVLGTTLLAAGIVGGSAAVTNDPSLCKTGTCCTKDCCKDCPNCKCSCSCCKDCSKGCECPNKK
jgi:hypothetical protein